MKIRIVPSRSGRLKEELTGGKIAIVYHQSDLEPQKFLEIMKSKDFRSSYGIYGKGLYSALYRMGEHLKDASYGRYTYKLKVNLDKFIIFDPKLAVKVHKFSGVLQQTRVFYGEHLMRDLKAAIESSRFVTPNSNANEVGDEQVDSDAFDFLSARTNGLVVDFQPGRPRLNEQDDAIVVVFDPTTAVPLAWQKSNEQGWTKFPAEREIVRRTALGLRTPNPSPEKFERNSFYRELFFKTLGIALPVRFRIGEWAGRPEFYEAKIQKSLGNNILSDIRVTNVDVGDPEHMKKADAGKLRELVEELERLYGVEDPKKEIVRRLLADELADFKFYVRVRAELVDLVRPIVLGLGKRPDRRLNSIR